MSYSLFRGESHGRAYPTSGIKSRKNSFRILSARFVLVEDEGKIHDARGSEVGRGCRGVHLTVYSSLCEHPSFRCLQIVHPQLLDVLGFRHKFHRFDGIIRYYVAANRYQHKQAKEGYKGDDHSSRR